MTAPTPNSRLFPRAPITFQAKLVPEQGAGMTLAADNLSLGGVGGRIPRALDIDSFCHASFLLPRTGQPPLWIQVRCRVSSCIPLEEGWYIGLQFISFVGDEHTMSHGILAYLMAWSEGFGQ